MLRLASDQAAGIIADARREADDIVTQARRSAEAAVAQARAAGREEAAALAAAERSRGRTEARSVLLTAQRATLGELRSQVRAAVTGLRGEPGYGKLLDRLIHDGPARGRTGRGGRDLPGRGCRCAVAAAWSSTARCPGSRTWPSRRLGAGACGNCGHHDRHGGRVVRVNGPLVEVAGTRRRWRCTTSSRSASGGCPARRSPSAAT